MGRVIAARTRTVVFDGIWQYGTGERQNRLPRSLTVHQPGELAAVLRKRLSSTFTVLYQPEFHPENHFDYLCGFVARVGPLVGGLTLAIDEVQEIGGKDMSEQFSFLARCGRHRGVSLIYTCQRPQDCPVRLRSLSRYLRVFRLQDPADIAFLRPVLPQDLLLKLPSLRDRQYFSRGDGAAWTLVNG